MPPVSAIVVAMEKRMETAKMKIEAFEAGYIQAVGDFARVLDSTFGKMSKKTRKTIVEMIGHEKFNSVGVYAQEVMKEHGLFDMQKSPTSTT